MLVRPRRRELAVWIRLPHEQARMYLDQLAGLPRDNETNCERQLGRLEVHTARLLDVIDPEVRRLIGAETNARRTAPAPALGDFRRKADDFMHDDSVTLPAPDWNSWAWRLSGELESLLERLQHEKADAAATRLAQIRLVLDHFGWESDDRQYALEQIDDILRGSDW